MSSTASTALSPAPHQAVRTVGPESLAGWELVERLSSGRYTEVFLARPRSMSGQAAYVLKRLRSVWDDVPESIAAVIREAEVGRSVSHPHLLPVLDAQTGRPPRYVVFPRLTGSSLAELVAHGIAGPLPQRLWFVRQAAGGLAALHAAGWLHGDFKPAHVLVSPAGHATLIDLGFAQRISETTPRNSIPGTPQYLAPECLTSTLRVDARSDLYSLGATLFELLAGRPPFVADTQADLARAHRQDRPADLRALVPSLPLAVVQLVRDLLAKDPLRRPDSAQEVVERLWCLEIETFEEWDAALCAQSRRDSSGIS